MIRFYALVCVFMEERNLLPEIQKIMKKFLSFAIILACLVGCDTANTPEHSTSCAVKTDNPLEIACYSAALGGRVKVDVSKYEEIKVGVMFSDNLEDMNYRTAPIIDAGVLYGDEFEVEMFDLTPETEYYYCTCVLLNGVKYEFGEIKKFSTKEYPKFMVGEDKQVFFSQGNLQYQQTWEYDFELDKYSKKGEYRFAYNQLDYIGEGNQNIDSTGFTEGWIDLFGWGTGDNPSKISTQGRDYMNFIEWGRNTIDDYEPYTWRTLNEQEWNYLLYERTDASLLQAVATVTGVNGIILLPDNWECPRRIDFIPGLSTTYGVQGYAAHQSFDEVEWKKLQATGAVFLPAAGQRYGTECSKIEESGHYWTSTSGRSLDFYSNSIGVSTNSNTSGFSVRLVSDTNPYLLKEKKVYL